MKKTKAITAKGHFSTGAIERLIIAPRTTDVAHIPSGLLIMVNNLFPSSRFERIKYNFIKNCIVKFLTVRWQEVLPQEGVLFYHLLPVL